MVKDNRNPLSSDRNILSIILVGIVLILIAFWPAFNAGFVNWDDNLYVYENATVQSLSNFGTIISEPVAGNYHPLTMISLAVDYAISGGKAGWFHAVNLFLHIINFVLVFLLFYHLSGKKKWLAAVVAFLFALHPLHVESVAWISERKDVLYSAFFLGALLLYLSYLKDKRPVRLLGVGVLFLFSLLSKPAAVVFPLVLLVIDFYYSRLGERKTYIEKIPFFVMSLIFGIITLSVQKSAGSFSDTQLYPLASRFFFANYGVAFYLFKTLIPFNLSAFYPFPAVNQALPVYYYLSLLVTLALLGLVVFSAKKNKMLTFSILFYVINLVLVLQFFSVGSAVVADRYSYLPLLGPFFLVGFYVQKTIDINRGKATYVVLGLAFVVLLGLTVLTRRQVATWQNGAALWEQAIKAAASGQAYSNRAQIYREEGNVDKAFEMYSKAIETDRYESDALVNRANIYFNRGKYQQAIEDYSACIAIEPKNDKALANRGAAYLALGKNELALADLNRTIELNPSTNNGFKNRAMLYLMAGQYQQSIRDYLSHLSITPDRDGEIWYKVGYSYQQMGQHAKAIDAFTQALRCREKGHFYAARALSLVYAGNIQTARTDASKAASLGAEVDQLVVSALSK
jgi:hypothetical protein